MCVLKIAPSGDIKFLDVRNRQFFNCVAELDLISSFKNYSTSLQSLELSQKLLLAHAVDYFHNFKIIMKCFLAHRKRATVSRADNHAIQLSYLLVC